MRTLHESRRDWLSDEEHWLASQRAKHIDTVSPTSLRHSWKLMVEFFLALKTNIGSWIQNLERRDMMLLGTLMGTKAARRKYTSYLNKNPP